MDKECGQGWYVISSTEYIVTITPTGRRNSIPGEAEPGISLDERRTRGISNLSICRKRVFHGGPCAELSS